MTQLTLIYFCLKIQCVGVLSVSAASVCLRLSDCVFILPVGNIMVCFTCAAFSRQFSKHLLAICVTGGLQYRGI
jgi:hypothetical protein